MTFLSVVVLHVPVGLVFSPRLGKKQFLLAIPVQVGGQIIVIPTAEDLHRLAVLDGIAHQVTDRSIHLPAHQDLTACRLAEFQVVDGLDLGADPFDAGPWLVLSRLILAENDDFQRGFCLDIPEEGHGLLDAVPVHIHQLDGLAVLAAQGRNILGASLFCVDLGLEVHIGLRGFGQSVHLLHTAEDTAGEAHQAEEQGHETQDLSCHGVGLPPFVMVCGHTTAIVSS